MTAKNNLRLVQLLAMLLLALFAASCTSGGGDEDNEPDPNDVRPSITGLSRAAANVGDQVTIFGLNFGLSQSGSTVNLNGVPFGVSAWSDTAITATVTPGMETGVVVVRVNNLDSQSGQEAKLTIGAAVPGSPIINALNPDYGRKGTDQILITGLNFGVDRGTSRVVFTAEGGGTVDASIVTVDVAGVITEQWSNSSIQVNVPATAASGPVFVEVGAEQSNTRSFTALPPDAPLGAPFITEMLPPNGAVGSQISIVGGNFGNSQGNSSITIGGLTMTVLSWSNNLIVVEVPAGATSGSIRVIVGGVQTESQQFTVANQPVITGISPSAFKIGQSFSVFGDFFGFQQGAGSLKIGSTTVDATTWNNNEITVDALPSINVSDPDAVPVVVTADNGLASEPFNAQLVSDLKVLASVDPTSGEGGTTTFNFSVSVAGGSGSYEFTLIPDASDAEDEGPTSSASPLSYVYPSVGATTTYSTLIRVKDKINKDTTVIDGPQVTVVPAGTPVITGISIAGFNRGAIDAPNDMCYRLDLGTGEELYHTVTFFNGQTFFHSGLSDVFNGPNPVDGFTHDLKAFTTSGSDPRPYGYRYAGAQGSRVRLSGLNFGASIGSIALAAGVGPGIPLGPGDVESWSNTEIVFFIPSNNSQSLSGPVKVTTSDAKSATSSTPLICSALPTQVIPATVESDGVLTIIGFDLAPPQIPGVTGGRTYLVWKGNVSYENPFNGQDETAERQFVLPALANVAGTSISFDMSSLAAGLQVEVFNATGDTGLLVPATMEDGDYEFFLWTGVLTDGNQNAIALSGLFSQSIGVAVGEGGGGGGGEGTISGFIFEIDSTDPKPNVQVKIWVLQDYNGQDATPGVAEVTSGANGFYEFTGLTDDGTVDYVWHPVFLGTDSYARTDGTGGPYFATPLNGPLTDQNYEVGFAGGT